MQEDNILTLLRSCDSDNIALGLQLLNSITGDLPESLQPYRDIQIKYRDIPINIDGRWAERVILNCNRTNSLNCNKSDSIIIESKSSGIRLPADKPLWYEMKRLPIYDLSSE